MRIHGFGSAGIEDRERAKADATAQGQDSGKTSGQDPVVVSSGAQEITAAVARQSAARSQRVAAVRAQVESGTYKVDKDKLAERLADDELARAWNG